MNIDYDKLVIKQRVEGLEIFTDFETKNKYKIFSEGGKEFFYAYEESGFFSRLFLKKLRSLKIHIVDSNNSDLLLIEKGFAFFLPKFVVYDSDKSKVAEIKTRFKMPGTHKEIYDKDGTLIFESISKMMHPWTFRIFKGNSPKNEGHEVALITKKWSGGGKEIFTYADNFLVDFKSVSSKSDKELILALAFAIDLTVFERGG